MNTNGCPNGYFTDEILVYASTPFSCDSSISAWLGVILFLVTFRLFVLVLVWISWFQQQRRRSERARVNGVNRTSVARFPLIPFVSFLDVFMFSILFILSTTQVVSARQGVPLILLWLWMLPVCVIQLATLKKMVALGFNIFRFDLRPPNGQLLETDAIVNQISTFDRMLKALFVMMIALIVLCLCFAIVGLSSSVDPNHEFIFPRLSTACLTIEQALLYSSMMYQYNRCIDCVRIVKNHSSHNGATTTTHDSTTYAEAFQAAIWKMRYQQLVMFLTGVGSCTLFIYFCVTLQMYWWILAICLAIDCFVYFSMVLSFFQCKKPKHDLSNHTNSRSMKAATTLATHGNSVRHSGLQRMASEGHPTTVVSTASVIEDVSSFEHPLI